MAHLPMCHNILQMCRSLREMDQDVARAYMLVVLRRFREFAVDRRLDVVFSVSTSKLSELAISLPLRVVAYFG